MSTGSSSFARRLAWYLLIGFSLYWLGNVTVVFAWLFSKTLGIVVMFLSTVLWGYMSYYGLKHVPRKDWNKDTLAMGVIFLATAVIQDFFLYVLYRGVPDELYEASTLAAYATVLLIPFIVRYLLLRKYRMKTIETVSPVKLMLTALIGIVMLVITLWSVKFW